MAVSEAGGVVWRCGDGEGVKGGQLLGTGRGNNGDLYGRKWAWHCWS